jgi:hypothetical protein
MPSKEQPLVIDDASRTRIDNLSSKIIATLSRPPQSERKPSCSVGDGRLCPQWRAEPSRFARVSVDTTAAIRLVAAAVLGRTANYSNAATIA